jgi:hypothetical protein
MTCGSQSSRLTKLLLHVLFDPDSSVSPPLNNELGDTRVFGVLDVFVFNINGADGADFGAFAAGRAASCVCPLLVLIHYYLFVFAAEFKVKSVDSLDFIADADTSCAEDAAVSVYHEEVMS